MTLVKVGSVEMEFETWESTSPVCHHSAAPSCAKVQKVKPHWFDAAFVSDH